MQITLDQHEIETAIAAYARNLIHLDPSQPVGVEINVGRGANSHTASLSIGIASDSKTTPVDVIVHSEPPKKSNVSQLSLKSEKTSEAVEADEVKLEAADEAEAQRSDDVNNSDDARFQEEPDTTVATKKSLFSKG